jgi:hypothetical protein
MWPHKTINYAEQLLCTPPKSLIGDEVCLSSQEENQRLWKSAIFAKKK